MGLRGRGVSVRDKRQSKTESGTSSTNSSSESVVQEEPWQSTQHPSFSALPPAALLIKVANYTKSSDIVRNSQTANFKLGETFRLQQSWKSQTLTVQVTDTEKNRSLGSVSIPLSSLLGSDKVKEILPLNSKFPSQTLVLSAKLRFPFNPLPKIQG